ncbi:hypothetical protein ABZX12_14755 [Kribbella sp. NPDC003505]|uniref:hypothetical protein n=1 Tax=Kribbella sp. NPDC003505 TaxID=3154448 RepID=UPI0033BF2680
MRTLTTTLKTLRDHLDGDSPQSPGGFQSWCPAPRLRTRQTPADDAPIGVDEAGQPVSVSRDRHVLIAGDPRTLVTTAVRTIALHHARFPATRVHVYEPESLGDLTALRSLAHRYISTVGNGGATVPVTIDDLTSLAVEIDRRGKVLAKLNADIAAAGLDVAPVESIPQLHRLLSTAWTSKVAGAGIDADLGGLARHVVVIGDAIRWVLSEDNGQAFTDALTRVAIRGEAVGVSLVLGIKSPYLPCLPTDLIDAMPTRIALRLRNQDHADRVLGPDARAAGVDADDPVTGHSVGGGAFGMCWVAGAVNRARFQRAQIYATDPRRFAYAAVRLASARRREQRLTGDAATRDLR